MGWRQLSVILFAPVISFAAVYVVNKFVIAVGV